MTTASGQISLTLTITEEENGFSALGEETGTASCGDTLDEAVRNIKDAVATELKTMQHLGELERYLSEKGIETHQDKSPRKSVFLRPNQFVTQQNFDAFACR